MAKQDVVGIKLNVIVTQAEEHSAEVEQTPGVSKLINKWVASARAEEEEKEKLLREEAVAAARAAAAVVEKDPKKQKKKKENLGRRRRLKPKETEKPKE